MKLHISEQTIDINVKHPGILEVPDGKNVDDLPMSHFEKLVKKNGLAKITRALNNIQVWNTNRNPKLSRWAHNMINRLKKSFDNEQKEGITMYNKKTGKLSINENNNSGDIVTWADLNETQKSYVVSNAYKFPALQWIWEFYNENIMEWLHIREDEVAKQLEDDYDIVINTDKLYWGSNSQGPYPEWSLANIFDDIFVGTDGPEATISFDGVCSTEIADNYSIELYYYDDLAGDYTSTYGLTLDDLKKPSYKLPKDFIEAVESKLTAAKEALNSLWDYIKFANDSVPEDEQIRAELDAYDIADFIIINNEMAEPYVDGYGM